MAQQAARAPHKVQNNQSQGRTGSATPQKKGPATPGGSLKSNKTSGGGINRPTKGGVPSY